MARRKGQGRTRLRLNAFGENVSERDLTEVLVTICRRRGWRLTNFHVAPLLIQGPPMMGMTRNPLGHKSGPKGRHEWWIELKPGTVATPTGVQMSADLDAELQRVSPGYGSKREARVLDAPFVRLVMPGVFGSTRNSDSPNDFGLPCCSISSRVVVRATTSM